MSNQHTFDRNTKSVGTRGEDLATDYLKKHGYKILERNFKIPFGEVDIIAQKDNFLIFVEVKYRTSLAFGRPEDAVNMRKIYKLRKLVEFYYQEHKPKLSPKIEVLSIWKEGEEVKIKHIQGIVF